MKKFLWFVFVLIFSSVGRASSGDEFFRAMKDEMARSKSELRLAGNPDPYYIVYRLKVMYTPFVVKASMGALYRTETNSRPAVNAGVLLSSGNGKQDSFGVEGNHWFSQRDVGQSYDALRHSFWEQTNEAYLAASDLYARKEAYRRRKTTDKTNVDFIPGKQSIYVEEPTQLPPLDKEQLQNFAKALSAKGKNLPMVYDFYVELSPEQTERYFLNNLGGQVRYGWACVTATWRANFRTQAGYNLQLERKVVFDAAEGWQPRLEKAIDEFIAHLQQIQTAKTAEAYIGPVLLMPAASAQMWDRTFVKNMIEFSPLVASDGTETSGGSFKDKIGLRVVSPEVDVYDKPFLRTYDGRRLKGFTIRDDEGVTPQELTLIKDGFLREIPTSSRPFKEGIRSNGHGRSLQEFPRETLTNVIVTPHHPLSQKELEARLLEMCREQELAYCYIIHDLSEEMLERDMMEKIYTSDGHKEPVTGLEIETTFSPRLLRDIRAAGDEPAVLNTKQNISIVSPALLLEEMELVPTDKKPERPPLVPKP
ncbi:MAG: hypothetical protein J5601_02245 [Elusimicrobiaceae bacterium]|nr:hypothetical protein [Elusimicrobiaceae bacterium]